MSILMLAMACVEPGATELSDWSEGYEEEVEVEDPEFFQLIAPDDLGYPIRLGEVGTGEPCQITVGETPADYQEIDCRLDISELDLYGAGMAYDVYVPLAACEYLVYRHPQFEAWEVGVGPTQVSYSVSPDGVIFNEVNSTQGVPYCEYDYGWLYADGPNCCTGSYQIEVTYVDDAGNPLEVSTTPPLGWGGKPADCYNGAAFDSPSATFNEAGWPLGTIVGLYGGTFSERHEWDELSDEYYSNMVLASYFDPADHDGLAPEGMMADYSVQKHTYLCYDNAEELLAQITLDVREWNEFDEFTSEGDPDTTGTEPVTGEPLDDRDDWATGTPGTGTWIEWAL